MRTSPLLYVNEPPGYEIPDCTFAETTEDSKHEATKYSCNLGSVVSSGWKLVAMTRPLRTATTRASGPRGSCSSLGTGKAVASRRERTSSGVGVSRRVCIMGARMKIPRKGVSGSRNPSMYSGSSNDSTYALHQIRACGFQETIAERTCRPNWFLTTLIGNPPIPSCPPFFFEPSSTSSAKRIQPAQVPQTAFASFLTNSLNGSNMPVRFATRAMVVDSPPGMMRASQSERSSGVRTARVER